MSVTIDCQTQGFVTFPGECVRCGKPPKTIMTIDAARRIDVVVAEHETYREITVPLCRWCKTQRLSWGFLIGLVIVVGCIGGGMHLVHTAPKDTRLWFVTGLLVVVAAVVLYIRNWHSTVMNRLFLGCSTGRLQKDGTFRMWLRRKEIADCITYEDRPRKYIEKASYATHEERAQQQIASWWGKCLVGLLLMAGAGMIFYEITQFEDGRKRFLNLPSILMLVYDFLGKWAVCVPLAVPGAVLFGLGIRQLAGNLVNGE